MAIEIVRTIDAPVEEVINRCQRVAGTKKWKAIASDSSMGQYTYKTPFSLRTFWGHYVDVSIQRLENSTLVTVWVGLAGIQMFDPTREGARVAREFIRDVLVQPLV